MTVSSGNLDALVGFSGPVSDLYAIAVTGSSYSSLTGGTTHSVTQSFSSGATSIVETYSNGVYSASAIVAISSATSSGTTANIGETFTVTSVNDTTNSLIVTLNIPNHSSSQLTFNVLSYNQDGLLLENTTSVPSGTVVLGITNMAPLEVLSTSTYAAPTVLTFSNTSDYAGFPSSAQIIISGLYLSILGRTADSSGLANFVSAIYNGGTYTQIRTLMANSPEGIADVNGLYESVLGRPTDSGGAANAVQYLTNGGSLAGLRTGLATSAEAQTDINNAYMAVLGRPVDSSGLTGVEQALAAGTSLSSLPSILAHSTEAQNDINGIYQSVLGRTADTGGLATYEQYLANGGSLSGIRTLLAKSPEAQADINSLYQAVLGRPADASGIATYTQSLSTIASLAGIRTALGGSLEAQNKVTVLLQTDEGHTPTAAEVQSGQLQLQSGLSLTDLNAQTLNLASNPTFITGQGGTLQATAGTDEFKFGPGTFGNDTIVGFNPATDVIALSTSQFANLGVVTSDLTAAPGGAIITLNESNSIFVQGVSPSAIVPADIKFM